MFPKTRRLSLSLVLWTIALPVLCSDSRAGLHKYLGGVQIKQDPAVLTHTLAYGDRFQFQFVGCIWLYRGWHKRNVSSRNFNYCMAKELIQLHSYPANPTHAPSKRVKIKGCQGIGSHDEYVSMFVTMIASAGIYAPVSLSTTKTCRAAILRPVSLAVHDL